MTNSAPEFTAEDLEDIAGSIVFERGEDLAFRFANLVVHGNHATGLIRGTDLYRVDLEWFDDDVDGECTCPHYAEGNFCKHLVALGLTVIDYDGATDERGHEPLDEWSEPYSLESTRDWEEGVPQQPLHPAIDKYLATLDENALRELVVELAGMSESVRSVLEGRAEIVTATPEELARNLEKDAMSIMRVGGFVDYAEIYDVAAAADGFLEGLEELLDEGMADVVAPALLKMTTRLRAVSMHSDDSDGVLGDTGQRAVDLYARACREGNPDGVKLAKWLAKFREDSPGWPEVDLKDFVDAMGEKGLETYRRAITAMEKRIVDAGAAGYQLFDLHRIQLELADHDGDVDRAIEILTAGETPDFPKIINRLRDAGREREAMAWLDRAIDAGRIEATIHGQRSGYYWVALDDAVNMLAENGREEEALGLAWSLFTKSPSVHTLNGLKRTEKRLGTPESMVDLAWMWIDSQTWETGDVAIEIALAQRDVEKAWEAADRWGAGRNARRLADLDPQPRPAAALAIYRELLKDALVPTGRKEASIVVSMLKKMRKLAKQSGELTELDNDIKAMRVIYHRRPTLIAALDKARMP